MLRKPCRIGHLRQTAGWLGFLFARLSDSLSHSIETWFHSRFGHFSATFGHLNQASPEETDMRVSDILKVKGSALFTVTPDTPLAEAVDAMAAHDIGSLVVMEYGDLVGMLTFREIIVTLRDNGGTVGTTSIRKIMDDHPLTCTPETDVNEVRRMMLEHHVRYLPVMESRALMGVISFYDVAKAVVEEQGFENRMLKAYIRDWPEEQEPQQQPGH
jgi:CBS domain-containing protein